MTTVHLLTDHGIAGQMRLHGDRQVRRGATSCQSRSERPKPCKRMMPAPEPPKSCTASCTPLESTTRSVASLGKVVATVPPPNGSVSRTRADNCIQLGSWYLRRQRP